MNNLSIKDSLIGNKQSGFTLVELSIVLVIIGLLTGMVTVGQSMIKQAKLRAVISEVQQYKAAIYTFKDKYGQLPGDFTMATNFWGSDTANGNGDGEIHVTSTSGWESLRVFEHMSLASIISGNYTS